MPSLVDLLRDPSIQTLKQLIPDVQDIILDIGSRRDEDDTTAHSQFVVNPRWDDAVQLAEPILRWVHGRMWVESKSAQGLPHPYQRQWTGWLKNLVREVAGSVATERQLQGLASQLSTTLRANKLAFRRGGGKSKDWWVAPWPATRSVDVYTGGGYYKTDPKVEKRIADETDKPVTVYIDITKIPLPEPNPRSVMEWAKKVLPAAQKLQTLATSQAKTIQAYEQTITELEQQVKELTEKVESSGWEDFSDELGNLIKGE